MPEEFKARLDYAKFGHEPLRSMYAIERYLHDCGINVKLLHMMKSRASQINGCAYCIDMHWKDARAVARPTNVSTVWMRGANLRTTRKKNAWRSSGPKLSRLFQKRTLRMTSTSAFARSTRKRNWWILPSPSA